MEGVKEVSISPKMKICAIWRKIERCPPKLGHILHSLLSMLNHGPENLIWASFVAQSNSCVVFVMFLCYGGLGDLVTLIIIIIIIHYFTILPSLFCNHVVCVCCGA